jgi:hypothetical protein
MGGKVRCLGHGREDKTQEILQFAAGGGVPALRERLGYDVGAWRLCPSCRLAYGKGAFWGGLLVAVVVGIFKWLIL